MQVDHHRQAGLLALLHLRLGRPGQEGGHVLGFLVDGRMACRRRRSPCRSVSGGGMAMKPPAGTCVRVARPVGGQVARHVGVVVLAGRHGLEAGGRRRVAGDDANRRSRGPPSRALTSSDRSGGSAPPLVARAAGVVRERRREARRPVVAGRWIGVAGLGVDVGDLDSPSAIAFTYGLSFGFGYFGS